MPQFGQYVRPTRAHRRRKKSYNSVAVATVDRGLRVVFFWRIATGGALDRADLTEERLAQVRALGTLAEARGQADAILSETRSDAGRLRDELKQKAQAEAAGVVKNAERQIEMETARALQQIRNEAVDISIAIASKLLERNVSKEDNERLIEETFKQIEARRPS